MRKSDRNIQPEDALKSFDQTLVVDPRNSHWQMVDWHARVAEIKLIDSTPVEVRQLFENAKNIALYAYFSYRLHQPAEAIAFSALEKALKMKFALQEEKLGVIRRPNSMAEYMDVALEQGWITDEGYVSSRHVARARVEARKAEELIKEGGHDEGEAIPIPIPEPHEVDAEMRSMGTARRRLHAGRRVRNYLAHGEGGLAPSSVGTLCAIAEEINQLFGG